MFEYLMHKAAEKAPEVMSSAIGTALSLCGAWILWKLQEWRLYGRWHVVIKNGDSVLCVRPVGSRKAKEILDDLSTLSVFLKGVASPFGWLNIDIVSEQAKELGLLYVHKQSRAWIIDISKNPAPPPKGGPAKG